jgi:large subunit ribosomal protein L35
LPKLKTNRGAAKRFSRTGTGKIKRAQSFRSHILTKKSPKRERQLRSGALIAPADEATIRQMIPGI